MPNKKEVIQSLLSEAHIILNGTGDADIQVANSGFYDRVLREGVLGFGESYMDGWWEVKKPDDLFYRLINASLHEKVKSWKIVPYILKAKIFNFGKQSKAFEVGKKHYDIGNTLFQKMLDHRMVYSCGYWKEAENLEEAQEAKLDLICRKLNLQPDMKVLDVGCGWGSFCKYAAEKYCADVVGITISKEQAELAKKNCKGLNVKIKLQDYRDLNAEAFSDNGNLFDRVVSVGMFEHVGYKNYRVFMKTIHRILKNNGLFLLHTIGANKSMFTTDPWTHKYIFPNSMLPSIKQIGASIEQLFVMEDWHNFGPDYDKTLMAWFKNFDHSWDELKLDYDERFYRMWKYYLLSCAGSFRAGKNQLWQIVLSKNSIANGYQSIR
ncbi:MAG: cyclopropane-fatty-acyl-phospholipid synthase [Bacteroidetes bacterium GWB2_41_8]|nr:MAG: cyclopropane-fatty-acyl-phospholipid synthase [Bacteroidetes bacterium GWB2_41_8]